MTHSSGPCGGCGCTSGACDGGCCAGVRTVTPRPAYERPGLPALHSRIGTYRDFLETMTARLAAHAELDRLTVRTLDDPSMALLDCWSVVADTVTFYGERALNEGYLGTATQPDSVSRLGRLVGYQPAACPRLIRPPRLHHGARPGRFDPGRLVGQERPRSGGTAADLRDLRGPGGAGGVEPARGQDHPPVRDLRVDGAGPRRPDLRGRLAQPQGGGPTGLRLR